MLIPISSVPWCICASLLLFTCLLTCWTCVNQHSFPPIRSPLGSIISNWTKIHFSKMLGWMQPSVQSTMIGTVSLMLIKFSGKTPLFLLLSYFSMLTRSGVFDIVCALQSIFTLSQGSQDWGVYIILSNHCFVIHPPWWDFLLTFQSYPRT